MHKNDAVFKGNAVDGAHGQFVGFCFCDHTLIDKVAHLAVIHENVVDGRYGNMVEGAAFFFCVEFSFSCIDVDFIKFATGCLRREVGGIKFGIQGVFIIRKK